MSGWGPLAMDACLSSRVEEGSIPFNRAKDIDQ